MQVGSILAELGLEAKERPGPQDLEEACEALGLKPAKTLSEGIKNCRDRIGRDKASVKLRDKLGVVWNALALDGPNEGTVCKQLENVAGICGIKLRHWHGGHKDYRNVLDACLTFVGKAGPCPNSGSSHWGMSIALLQLAEV